MPVHVFVSGAVIAPIVRRVEEDIVVGSRAVASVAVVVALGFVVGADVAIIDATRRFPRVCAIVGLLSR